MLQHLPPDLKEGVDREVRSGRYRDATEVIAEALTRMADEESRVTVAEALAQVERGEVVEYTEDFLQRSAERARGNVRRGHKVRDDVRY